MTAASPVAAAGALGDYRLLVLDGRGAKWGSPVPGTGAALTYAIATKPLHTDGAVNCGEIDPIDRVLAASRVSAPAFDAEVAAAFAAWSAVADISFVHINSTADADIVIGAEGLARGRAFTNVATAASPVPAGGVARPVSAGPAAITRSLICLNPTQRWKVGFDGDLGAYDMRYALMHEIGHAIGLDHPDAANTVMDYHYTEAFSKLQPGDIAGVTALYGTRTIIARAANAGPAPLPNR